MKQPIDTNSASNLIDTGANTYNYEYFNDANSLFKKGEVIIPEGQKKDVHCVIKGKIRQKYLHNTHNMGLDWILIALLLILFVFAWLKATWTRYLGQIIDSIINYQGASKLFRDSRVHLEKVSVIVNIIYVVVLSLFLFEIIKYSNIVITVIKPIFLFPMILLLVSSTLFTRLIFLKFMGFVFYQQKQYEESAFNILLYNKGIGIILFPIVALMPYSPAVLLLPLKIIGIGVIILMNVLKITRGVKIILSKDILIFYLILYFCALEILPLLLMYKFIYSFIQ